jgi:hypothetical protein
MTNIASLLRKIERTKFLSIQHRLEKLKLMAELPFTSSAGSRKTYNHLSDRSEL